MLINDNKRFYEKDFDFMGYPSTHFLSANQIE